MSVRVVFSPEALADLSAAISFIAQRNPAAAKRVSDAIFLTVDRLADRDFEGPEHRLTTGELVRNWPVSPFRIYYRRTNDLLEILRIYHHARSPIAR